MVEANNEAAAAGDGAAAAEKEKLTWDKKTPLTEEELKRQEAFFAPLQDDIWEWMKTFTEEEKERQEAFEASMRVPDEEEGGTATREAFQKEIDDAWDEVHTEGNGIINE